jgi:hypothetical protein
MPRYFHIADNRPVDASEAVDESGAMKAGYGLRFGLIHDARTVDAPGRSQDAYERRIASAWMADDARVDAIDAKAVEARRDKHGISQSQSVFETRLADAWRSPR